MRNISAWSIRNPVFALVLFAALTLRRASISFMRMDVNQNPEITFPGVDRRHLAAGRRAGRDGDADRAEGRGGGAQPRGRGRDQHDDRPRDDVGDVRPVHARHAGRSRHQRRARGDLADPRIAAQRHPRAAGDARHHRRRSDRALVGQRQRHDAGTALLVREERRLAPAARRSTACRASRPPAGSAARSA